MATLSERVSPAPVPTEGPKWKVLFICGSLNQTRQMHQIARALPECEAYFTPYYCDGYLDYLRRWHLTDFTILGWPLRRICMRYLRRHGLPMDFEGRRFSSEYDMVVTCSDVVIPKNVCNKKLVAVQEGMTDPERFWYWARKILPVIPRWAAGTAWTGTSNLYDVFCVASEGYRDLFARKGADRNKMMVTGIPNFDDCARYLTNAFPHHGYVLACTSDARETLKFDNRRKFIDRALAIAAGRPLFFKLHPNEDHARSRAEIERWAPGALVFARGSAEEMVANSDVVICQYSTLAFVGLALGKEVHSYFDIDDLRRLLPVQGGRAAHNIAAACRSLLRGQSVRFDTMTNAIAHPLALARENEVAA